MKKLNLLLLPLSLICLVGCQESSSNPDLSSNQSSSVAAPINAGDIWDEKYASTGFEDATVVEQTKYWKDGNYQSVVDAELDKTADYKYEFYKGTQLRYVDVSNGYALTVKKNRVIDRSMAKNGTHFSTSSCDLRISAETPAPYTLDYKGFKTYMDEWTLAYLRIPAYYSENNFTKFADSYEDSTAINPDYSISAYFVSIENHGAVKFPNYHIAVVRPKRAYSKFLVIVYKSRTADKAEFEDMLKSITMFTGKGTAKNYMGQQEKKINSKWSSETKRYYERFCNLVKPDWTFFEGSMNNCASDDVAPIRKGIVDGTNDLEADFDYDFEIVANYAHIAWGSSEMTFASLCNELAGGNGFNGKKVLQYTYQYTINNNNLGWTKESNVPTTLIEVLRGTYDSTLKKLAKGIKAYAKPVLFRLNNEMNTDWTTYCGLYNLLDPQLFIDSWIYLYDIFESEGVNNCIWIWNPFDTNSPRTNWSQEMNYFPGTDYVQAIGVTSYEFNNGATDGVAVLSFRTRFSNIYDSYSQVFMNLPWIASEFGCASGGATTGDLGRNQRFQAKWVADMFSDIVKKKAYCSNIKAYVWFDCNDWDGDLVKNYLHIGTELTDTRTAFREGFAALKQMA